MAIKTLTPTQLFNAVQRLENIDISQLDFTKLPSGFSDANTFEKSITKTLNNVKAQFASAYKTYETNERNEKLNNALKPWIDRFDGNLDKALEALQTKISMDAASSSNQSSDSDAQSEHQPQNTNYRPEHTTF